MLIVKLSVEHKMPLEQISQVFEDLYGYDLNSATIASTLEHGYNLVESVGLVPQRETDHY